MRRKRSRVEDWNERKMCRNTTALGILSVSTLLCWISMAVTLEYRTRIAGFCKSLTVVNGKPGRAMLHRSQLPLESIVLLVEFEPICFHKKLTVRMKTPMEAATAAHNATKSDCRRIKSWNGTEKPGGHIDWTSNQLGSSAVIFCRILLSYLFMHQYLLKVPRKL